MERSDGSDLWRIVTLNIWNRQGPWPERLPLIREGLRALDADVIGLQEVLAFGGASQAHEIAEGLGWNVYYAPAWQIGGGLTFGNAILSPHRSTTRSACRCRPRRARDPQRARSRGIECAHGPMPVFATHLTLQPHLGHVRCEQVRALADHVAALAPIEGPPPVLAGDFNADPDADEMRFLRGLTPLGGEPVYFADCWLACGRDGPGLHVPPPQPVRAALARTVEANRLRIRARPRPPPARGAPTVRLVMDEPTGDIWPSDDCGVAVEVWASKRHHDPY